MPSSPLLTFDDGPGPSTPALLDVLRDAGCVATFFVLGRHLAAGLPVAERIVREGHVLGNHTWSHARAGALTATCLAGEIHATDAWIRRAYADAGGAVPHTIPLRLPYGPQDQDPRVAVLAALGRDSVGWTLMLPDWERPAPSGDALARQMREHAALCRSQGHQAVFCLHDGSRHGEPRPATVAAVRAYLDGARAWQPGVAQAPAR